MIRFFNHTARKFLQLHRDLCISLSKLGDYYYFVKQHEQARATYEKYVHEIKSKFDKSNSSSTFQDYLDYIVSLVKFADIEYACGNQGKEEVQKLVVEIQEGLNDMRSKFTSASQIAAIEKYRSFAISRLSARPPTCSTTFQSTGFAQTTE